MARQDPTPEKPLKIAIVGSGISGLSAAWLLNQHHDITLYEQDERLGGHSNTVIADTVDGPLPIDTGFIVFNPPAYPNLVALFDLLGVDTENSNMSFSVSLNDGALEYCGSGLGGLFAQRKNIASPKFLRMLVDLLRFYSGSRDWTNFPEDMTLAEFLEDKRYSSSFIHHHMLPMAAAIWSSPLDTVMDFPVKSFARFFNNHGLFNITDRPQWKTVSGGSVEYVTKIIQTFADKILPGRKVINIDRTKENVRIKDSSGETRHFDHVIMAGHPPDILDALSAPSDAERTLLGAINYQNNEAVLHTDPSFMPNLKSVWSSWNYLGSHGGPRGDGLGLTYWMNLLQNLPGETEYFVTLNPAKEIDPAKIVSRHSYAHPVFNLEAMHAQPKIWDIQGENRTWYCGAWMGYGFHEDGIQAGLAVAEHLGGIKRPWSTKPEDDRVHYAQVAL